jgi:hypothetical protein
LRWCEERRRREGGASIQRERERDLGGWVGGWVGEWIGERKSGSSLEGVYVSMYVSI